ncbi:MAG TPA: response regulator transcription factor [Capillimicrobium sp.]|jgi:DNA-binding NarL/FixJ family response regulator
MRVFLCDDVPEYRALMRAVLEGEPGCEVVGEAGDGPAGIAGVAATAPDVVVLDMDMPGGDGLSAIPQMRTVAPDARIIVLSSFEADRMERRAVEAGADAYLEKRLPLTTVADLVCRGA